MRLSHASALHLAEEGIYAASVRFGGGIIALRIRIVGYRKEGEILASLYPCAVAKATQHISQRRNTLRFAAKR